MQKVNYGCALFTMRSFLGLCVDGSAHWNIDNKIYIPVELFLSNLFISYLFFNNSI